MDDGFVSNSNGYHPDDRRGIQQRIQTHSNSSPGRIPRRVDVQVNQRKLGLDHVIEDRFRGFRDLGDHLARGLTDVLFRWNPVKRGENVIHTHVTLIRIDHREA